MTEKTISSSREKRPTRDHLTISDRSGRSVTPRHLSLRADAGSLPTPRVGVVDTEGTVADRALRASFGFHTHRGGQLDAHGPGKFGSGNPVELGTPREAMTVGVWSWC